MNKDRIESLFRIIEETGNSKGVRSKINKQLKEKGYTEIEIKTVRACLNNTLNLLLETDNSVIDYFNKEKSEYPNLKINKSHSQENILYTKESNINKKELIFEYLIKLNKIYNLLEIKDSDLEDIISNFDFI